ncbi:3-oxoacyl-ACP reductase FabG [bacterium]|nr:3-oxoacyl-ACP reductase FabG [bacterium]
MTSQNRVAIVTGASRGIGAAIADTLAASGLTVVGTATTALGAEKISQRFSDKSVLGQGLELDVTQEDAVSEFVKKVQNNFGAPLVLINNAGITKDNLLMRMSDDEWSGVIDTNLTAIFKLSKACLRGMMKARWGRIVSIGSIVGSMGNAGQANYAATKAGVAGFSRSLAKEIGSRNITVNTVSPGFIATDMTDSLDEVHKKTMLDTIPLARLGEPSEIASVVDFLVSDGAAYITGENIHVNGGMYMG